MTMALRAAEIVALLGPNGAGKSTLLDALAGAREPTHGQIERRGRVTVALQAPDLARRSVLVNVTLALAWWGVPRPERVQRAREALRMIGTEHLAQQPAGTLSGGARDSARGRRVRSALGSKSHARRRARPSGGVGPRRSPVDHDRQGARRGGTPPPAARASPSSSSSTDSCTSSRRCRRRGSETPSPSASSAELDSRNPQCRASAAASNGCRPEARREFARIA